MLESDGSTLEPPTIWAEFGLFYGFGVLFLQVLSELPGLFRMETAQPPIYLGTGLFALCILITGLFSRFQQAPRRLNRVWNMEPYIWISRPIMH